MLAWSGEVSHNPHSIVLPSDVGVCFHLESGIEVDVSIVDPKTMYEAVRVMVEPVTVEDWEMLDLNAGLVEAQLMNQVATVRSNSIIPVWINSSTVIRLSVKETVPAGIVRLAEGTEVVVAPKPRTVADKTIDPQESKKSARPKKALLRLQHYLAGTTSTHLICGRETMKRLRWSDGIIVCVSSVGSTRPFLERLNHSLRPTSSSDSGRGESSQTSNSKKDVYLRVFGSDSVMSNHALVHVSLAALLNLHHFSRFLVQPQTDDKTRSANQLHRLLLKPVRWDTQPSQRIEVPPVGVLIEYVNKWIASNARRVNRIGTAPQKSMGAGTYPIPMTNDTLIVLGGQHYAVYCNIISSKAKEDAGSRSASEDTREIFAELNSHMNSDGTQSSSSVQTIASMVPNLPGMAALQQFDQVREAGARALDARTEGKMRASREAAELAARQEASKDLFMIDADAVFSNDTIEVGTTIDSPWLFPLDYFIPSKPIPQVPSETSSSTSNSSTSTLVPPLPPPPPTPPTLSSHSRTSSASALSVTPPSPPVRPLARFPTSPFSGILTLTSTSLLLSINDIGGLDKELGEAMDTVATCLGRRLMKHQLGVKYGGLTLLCGPHGCGKSMMLRALGNHFARVPSLLACPLFVSCSEFSGMKVGKIIDSLNTIFQDAVLSQPSIILFDDLDALLPAENSESPQAWAAKAHHSQILSVVIKFIDSIIEKEHQVTIVATSQSNTSIHADLLHPFYLAHQLTLHAPNMKARAHILQKIISRK